MKTELCICGDRSADQCPGEWEQGCDLGANEKYVGVAEPSPKVASFDRGFYILQGRTPVPGTSDEWAAMMDSNTRRVGLTKIADSSVSTVFLGLDHSFGSGPPLLFETMVFGGPLNDYMERCSTWWEAEMMHQRACIEAHFRVALPAPAKESV